MSHRVCMCNCQVLLDSEPTIVAVAHIVLDQTIPAALWLNLVSSESQESPPTYNSSRWVHTKNLPEVVEICAFPSWARSFVLPTAADVVADFLTSERLKESVWSTALAKAKLVVEDEEEDEEVGEEEEEDSRRRKRRKSPPGPVLLYRSPELSVNREAAVASLRSVLARVQWPVGTMDLHRWRRLQTRSPQPS